MNSKLSWDTHISKIIGKAKRTLGFLNRNLQGCHKDTKIRAFTAFVRPLLEYCCVVWELHQEKLKWQLEAINRAGAPFVASKPYRRDNPDSVTSIMKELRWEPLVDRRRKIKATMLYKMVNRLVAIPESYLPERKQQSSARAVNNHQFLQQHANILLYQHSFIFSTIPLWNRLPEEVISAQIVDAFKV